MSWRPEGWENPFHSQYDTRLFELGADAMLGVLRKRGIQCDMKKGDIFNLDVTLVQDFTGPTIGRLVFIPEEKP